MENSGSDSEGGWEVLSTSSNESKAISGVFLSPDEMGSHSELDLNSLPPSRHISKGDDLNRVVSAEDPSDLDISNIDLKQRNLNDGKSAFSLKTGFDDVSLMSLPQTAACIPEQLKGTAVCSNDTKASNAVTVADDKIEKDEAASVNLGALRSMPDFESRNVDIDVAKETDAGSEVESEHSGESGEFSRISSGGADQTEVALNVDGFLTKVADLLEPGAHNVQEAQSELKDTHVMTEVHNSDFESDGVKVEANAEQSADINENIGVSPEILKVVRRLDQIFSLLLSPSLGPTEPENAGKVPPIVEMPLVENDESSELNLNDFTTSSVHRLLGDATIVESLQRLVGSKQIRDIILDMARNEVTTASEMKSVIKTHLGYVLPLVGQFLQEHPQTMPLVPDILNNIIGILFRDGTLGNEKECHAVKMHHDMVCCDGCSNDAELKRASIANGTNINNHIVGARYKSSVTHDFDLCESCEDTGKFDSVNGPFLKIKSPDKAPADIFCVLKEMDEQAASAANDIDGSDTDNSSFGDASEGRREQKERDHGQASSRVEGFQTTPEHRVGSVSDVLKCPGELHNLFQFKAPTGLFSCNVCDRRVTKGTILFGCRQCDWDVCLECAKLNYPSLEFIEARRGTGLSFAEVKLRTGELEMHSVKNDHVNRFNFVNNCGSAKVIATWEVKNTSGYIAWPLGTMLVCIDEGYEFGSTHASGNVSGQRFRVESFTRQQKEALACSLPPLARGELSVEIECDAKMKSFLKQAQRQGRCNGKRLRHVTVWRLRTPRGEFFGDELKARVFI